MSSQFNNLVKETSIASITPQQILAAGEPIFLDVMTSADLNSINKLIPAYQHIHTPNYGTPIPLSGVVDSTVGSETLLAPASSEIRKVIAINLNNAGGGAPIVANITLGGMIIQAGVTVAPGQTEISSMKDFTVSKNLPLAIAVTSGTASELTSSVASILLAQ